MVKKKKKKSNSKRPKGGILASPDLEGKPEAGLRVGMVEAKRETLLGNYCNIALIHHTPLEFCFDFIWSLGDLRLLSSRVITSPQHAKKLYRALGDNIGKYEKEYGVIELEKKDLEDDPGGER